MVPDIKAGDLIGVSGNSWTSWAIQLGTVSTPNVFGLGKWGLAGISHVGIVSPVWGHLLVYESTSFGRPPCIRTNRQNPKGVQAHKLSTILDAGGDVFHYPLRRPLYTHEEDRLTNSLESALGADYDLFSAGRAWGGIITWAIRRMLRKENTADFFCSELVAYAWYKTGVFQCRNAEVWNPTRLVRHAVRTGVVEKGRLIS